MNARLGRNLSEIMDEQKQKEILQEVESLCFMHEKITQSSECRDFNSRAALLLQRLEDAILLLTEPWISWSAAIPRTFPSATVCSGPGISWRG